MLAKEDISRMSSREREEALELLWESFAREGIDYPSPERQDYIIENLREDVDKQVEAGAA